LLAQATSEAGRPPGSVGLLAVSKGQPPAAVLEAVSVGQKAFGENFVQEAVSKMTGVGRDVSWHFIGRLQANKTRQVAEHFQWVHTIDRLKIAERLSRQRPYHARDLNVCIQVMVDPEDDKSGVAPDDLPELARAVASLPRLKLRGLMCIPAPRHDFEAQREPFRRLRLLSESLNAAGIRTDTLSMGMSDDYVAAIREGATLVRIGTALFGPRTGRGIP
jgi:pyridoxal phosphate enzyme (YggS family)